MEPILRQGMEGDAVRELQRLLFNKGFYDGPIDGQFGEAVTDAVINFQVAYDLLSDGVVTDEAWDSLREQAADDSSGFFSPRGFDELDDGFGTTSFDDHDELTTSPFFGSGDDISDSDDDEVDESDLNEDLMATISPAILAQTSIHEMWSDASSDPISAPDHFLHSIGGYSGDESGSDLGSDLGAEALEDFGDDLGNQLNEALEDALDAISPVFVDLVAAAQGFDLSNSQHAKALDNLQFELDSNILREFTRQWYAATETHITSLLEAFISYDYEGPATQETALEWVQEQLSPSAIQQFAMAWGQEMVRKLPATDLTSAENLIDKAASDLADALTDDLVNDLADDFVSDELGNDDWASDAPSDIDDGAINSTDPGDFTTDSSTDWGDSPADSLEDEILPDDVTNSVVEELTEDLKSDQSVPPSVNSTSGDSIAPPMPDSITDASSVMPPLSSPDNATNSATPPTMVSSLANASSSLGLLSSLLNDDDDTPDFSDLPPSQLLTQSGRFVPPKQISLVDAATSYSGLSHQSFALQTLDQKIDDQLRLDFCARWMVGSQDLGLRPDETPDIISLEESFHGYQPSQTPCQPVALKWLESQLSEVDLENFTKIWFSQNIGLAGRISLYEAANRYDPTRYPGQLEALNYINDQLGCQPGLLQQFAARWQSATSGMILTTAPMGITLKETFYNFNSDRHPSQILAFAWLERQLSPALLSEFSQRWYQAIRAVSEAAQ